MVYHVFDANKLAVNEMVDALPIPDEEFREKLKNLPPTLRIPLEIYTAANLCKWDNERTRRVLDANS